MPTVKSLEDLQKMRAEALKKREIRNASGSTQITVGMGTPGIAAGARETLREILRIIEEKKIANITVRQTGNIGLDSWEPVVQVRKGEEPPVTYGKVSPVAAEKIMLEHVLGGRIVGEYVVPD
jgi:NADP-reducing hydrogenase subunit HndB